MKAFKAPSPLCSALGWCQVFFRISINSSFHVKLVVNETKHNIFIFIFLAVTLETFTSESSCTFNNKSVSELCYSFESEKCLMNNTVTSNSDLKGCFWNPENAYFSCVVFENSSMFWTSECKESCPKVCSKNHWKCFEECIPVSQPCNGRCMPYYTFECNLTCIPRNKPCNNSCYDDHNQINCNGQCFDTGKEKKLIIKNGCTGQRNQLRIEQMPISIERIKLYIK